MTIHEHLTHSKPQLPEMGWTKARELVKGGAGDWIPCAPWVHEAKPKEQFRREVRALTGRDGSVES
jgi:hypothetical protein